MAGSTQPRPRCAQSGRFQTNRAVGAVTLMPEDAKDANWKCDCLPLTLIYCSLQELRGSREIRHVAAALSARTMRAFCRDLCGCARGRGDRRRRGEGVRS